MNQTVWQFSSYVTEGDLHRTALELTAELGARALLRRVARLDAGGQLDRRLHAAGFNLEALSRTNGRTRTDLLIRVGLCTILRRVLVDDRGPLRVPIGLEREPEVAARVRLNRADVLEHTFRCRVQVTADRDGDALDARLGGEEVGSRRDRTGERELTSVRDTVLRRRQRDVARESGVGRRRSDAVGFQTASARGRDNRPSPRRAR